MMPISWPSCVIAIVCEYARDAAGWASRAATHADT